ncbi:MAG TPA: hypothetical protein VGN81_00120 [Pseudonocardiaceae bacterium]
MSRRKKLLDKAAEIMLPGDAVELTAMAKLGNVAARGADSALIGVATGAVVAALGGGVGFVGLSQREVYIVLTTRQVIFFSNIPSTGGVGKHLASFDRTRVSVEEPRGSLFVCYRFMAEGFTEPVQLTFPPIPPSLRKEGRLLAAALPRPRPSN